MSEVITTRREEVRPSAVSLALERLVLSIQRLPLHLAIIIVAVIWLAPTFGLIVNSFRSVQDMGNAGWWTTLFPPHGFTLSSYNHVLGIENVVSSIVNSILITVPATVIQ